MRHVLPFRPGFGRRFFALLVSFGLLGLGLGSPAARAATVIQGSGQGHVAFEAERTPALVNGTPTFWAARAEAGASGGQGLVADGPNSTGNSPHSFAQYSIRFATAGTYYLYYRWRADEARTAGDVFTANSSWFGSTWGAHATPGDQSPFYRASANDTQAPANNAWEWRRENTTYEVAAGQLGGVLVFTMGTREAGMILDRFVLSTSADLTPAQLDALLNSDTDTVEQGSGENFAAFEAEGAKAKLINGTPTFWAARAEAGASGGQGLVADGPNSTGNSPHSFAQYSIRFATAGTYYLYYRWRADEARTAGDVFTANSSWFGSTWGAHATPGDQSPFYRASANDTQAPANNAWEWRRENTTYEVAAGQLGGVLVFTMGTREAGMILDRFVLSTSADLTPAQLDALPNSGAAPPAPELRSAVGSPALTQVTVIFTRPLNPATVSPARFTASGGLSVTGAAVDPEDARIVRLTTAAQTPGTQYTLTVNGVADTSGTPIQPNSTIAFTAWLRVNGWVTKEIFFGITGTTIDDLRSAPKFIENRPDRVDYVRDFALDRDPQTDNYGARLTAFYQPAAAGAHDFFVANDDESEVLLSTDASEANLQSYGVFPLSPREFDAAPTFTSAPLAAGQRYLLQGLLKQGGGDVYLRVGARSPLSAGTPGVLAGNAISTWVNPDLGKVTFTRQPANVTAAAGQRASFAVEVEGSGQPVYYQWQRDGVDIPGAIRRSYTTPVLTAADSGRMYRCVVSVAGVDTPSAAATLTVAGSDPSPLQPYIGVNFVGGGNSVPGPLLPQDVAGAVPQPNWNNLPGIQFDSVPLLDAAGAATPVTLTVGNLTETWYSGTRATATSDGWLLQGLVTAGSSTDPVSLTFTGVPAGTYQVLVYSVGFDFSPAYEQDYALTAGSTHPVVTGRAETGLVYVRTPAFRRISSTDPGNRATGNYVQFDNVTPAGGSITLDVTWMGSGGNGHQPAINAVQLVRVVPVAAPPVLGAAIIQGGSLVLTWTGGNPPFAVERRDTVTGTPAVVTTTNERTAAVPLTGAAGFFQVRGSN